ncbi:MAG: hypothetical protein ACE5KT_03980 [Methanosarcinales archaeon]
MVSKKEHQDFRECHYRVAKNFHQKGIHASDDLTKLTYLSSAVEHLLVSDDHLLNAFMYPNEFKSRRARHDSYEKNRKIRGMPKIVAYPSSVNVLRDRMLYLFGEKSIKEVLNTTESKLTEIFRRAEYVRNLIRKI